MRRHIDPHTGVQHPNGGLPVRRLPLLLVLVLPPIVSCARSVEERRTIFEEAERVNVEIFRGAVVRDLRAPSDSGRLVYDSAMSLREGQAQGAPQVWAPFGIAQPDTIR